MNPDTNCPVQSLLKCIWLTLHHAMEVPLYFRKEGWIEKKGGL